MSEARSSRDEWRKRVERWKDSGLTAKEFAAETGLNSGTLQFWRYKLKKADALAVVPRRRSPVAHAPAVSSIVEVAASRVTAEPRVEIELKNGRLLRVPATFESSALKALLAILDAA